MASSAFYTLTVSKSAGREVRHGKDQPILARSLYRSGPFHIASLLVNIQQGHFQEGGLGVVPSSLLVTLMKYKLALGTLLFLDYRVRDLTKGLRRPIGLD